MGGEGGTVPGAGLDGKRRGDEAGDGAGQGAGAEGREGGQAGGPAGTAPGASGAAQAFGRPTDSFMGVPAAEPAGAGGTGAAAVVLGVGLASPYRSSGAPGARAPAALRLAAAPLADWRGHVNFDLGRPGWPEGAVTDAGDLVLDPANPAGNRLAIRHAVAAVLEGGAAPVVLGGDASVLVPVLQGFEGAGPLAVLQAGARLGWREQLEGERWGAASALRRVAEMGHVGAMVQIGARGVGPDRAEDLAAARRRGVTLLPGLQATPAAVAAALPPAGPVFVAIDCDALDPATMPAVAAPVAGGLGLPALLEIVAAAAGRGRLAGCALTGLVPDHDAQGRGAALAVQLLAALLGRIAGGEAA